MRMTNKMKMIEEHIQEQLDSYVWACLYHGDRPNKTRLIACEKKKKELLKKISLIVDRDSPFGYK